MEGIERAFRDAVVVAIEKHSVEYVANGLEVSYPTVLRWAAGDSSPHPVMAACFLRFLERD